MKKILIIGHPGAGKSTLATKLGDILQLPVHHLDALFWQPGWIEMDRGIWREKQAELVATDKWIIDGSYSSSLDIRVPAADTIINLDFGTYFCLYRILKRMLGGYGRVRDDMADGCPERFDLIFVKWTWNYRKHHRPKIMHHLDNCTHQKIITLENQKEVDAFVAELAQGA